MHARNPSHTQQPATCLTCHLSPISRHPSPVARHPSLVTRHPPQGCHPDSAVYNALLGACWSSGVAMAQMRASLIWSAANRSGHFRVYHQVGLGASTSDRSFPRHGLRSEPEMIFKGLLGSNVITGEQSDPLLHTPPRLPSSYCPPSTPTPLLTLLHAPRPNPTPLCSCTAAWRSPPVLRSSRCCAGSSTSGGG